MIDSPGEGVVAVIRVSERAREPDGFVARVEYPDGDAHEVLVRDPAADGDEPLWAWYFERHLRYPFLDGDRRAAAVDRLRAYGEALFAQVFGGAAGESYRELRRRGFDGCRVEVSGSAAFHALHWEALRDPDLPTPLAVRVPLTRRVDLHRSAWSPRGPRPTLNILLVTARPGGAADVGYRTISRPLLDAVRTAGLPVTVELVRPGTWSALVEHLRGASGRHGTGWYDLVHFDLHCAFADHAEIEAGGYLFSGAEFAGRQGFLFFETAERGQADPRGAAEVAALLAEHRVPMAVLNACQSAMQSDSEAALAHRLVDAGVPVVVGMAYSVTVTAAALAMPELYARLADGADTSGALLAMRRALSDTPERQGHYHETLPLEDWVLPVVFQQRPLSLERRPMDPVEENAFYRRQETVGEEPRPAYGFVGRDLDIQAVERALLTGHNQLLIKGVAGAGKSTLLTHLAWWWQRTGLVDRVFAFRYDERAWTVDQIVHSIATDLWTGIDLARWSDLSEPARRAKVAHTLRATRHLLVLDNTESITASPAAIPHALDPPDRDALRTWLSSLRAGRTLVLWGSREPETWAATDTFADNVHPLPGLDPQAATTLADRILAKHGATHHRSDPNLGDLLDLLGGHPLAMEVVLPTLTTTPLEEVTQALEAGTDTADPVGRIHRALEYSHGKLDPDIQRAMLSLAPFTAVIPADPFLAKYGEILAERSGGHWRATDPGAGVAAAVDIGLATPHPHLDGWVDLVPVLPYFLRRRLAAHPDRASATWAAHHRVHAANAPLITMAMQSGIAWQRAAGHAAAKASYANLMTALDHAIGEGAPVESLVATLDEYLARTHQHSRRHDLATGVIHALERRPATETVHNELAFLFLRAGSASHSLARHERAASEYRRALDLAGEVRNRVVVASAYYQLGLLAQERLRHDEAERWLRQAAEALRENGNHRYEAMALHQLGFVELALDRPTEADAHLRRAVDILREVGDQVGLAEALHQLGISDEVRGSLDEAERHYVEAVAIFTEFGDRYRLSFTRHQLGMVAMKRGHLDAAEHHLKESLAVSLDLREADRAARTYHQLGLVALLQGRTEEAERLFRLGVRLLRERGDAVMAARFATLAARALGEHGHGPAALRMVVVAFSAASGEGVDGDDVALVRQLHADVGADEFAAAIEVMPDDLAQRLWDAVAEGE